MGIGDMYADKGEREARNDARDRGRKVKFTPPPQAPEPKAKIDTEKLSNDIVDFLSKWNSGFLLGRDALKTKLDEWLKGE